MSRRLAQNPAWAVQIIMVWRMVTAAKRERHLFVAFIPTVGKVRRVVPIGVVLLPAVIDG